MAEEEQKATLAYYQSLRSELVERVKQRDQIMMAFLAAVAALFGFALRPIPSVPFLRSLEFLIPLLSFGAIATICHHQEIISAFTEYFVDDLSKRISPAVRIWDHSEGRKRFGTNAEFYILASQLSLLLFGPLFLTLLLNFSPEVMEHKAHSIREWVAFGAGIALDMFALCLLFRTLVFRLTTFKKIFPNG